MAEVLPAPIESGTGNTAVATTAMANAALAAIAIVTGVLVARLLGAESRGLLAAAQVVGTLIGALGSLSLGESLVYFVARRVEDPKKILRSAMAFAIFPTLGLIAAGIAAMPLLLRGEPDAVTPARAYCLIGITFVLVGFPVTFMRGQQRYRIWNLCRFIGPVVWLISVVSLTVFDRADVTLLILLFVGGQALFIPVAWRLAMGRDRKVRPIERSLARPMIRYSTPLFLASLPVALNVRLDQLFLANVVQAEELGKYAVSVTWAAIGLPVISAIGAVLFPRAAASDPAQVATLLARSGRAGVLIALCCSAFSAATAPFLVPLLFGEEFRVSVWVSTSLAGAVGLLGVNGLLEEGLRGVGEPRSVLAAEAAGLAVTIVFLIMLVSSLGILGAAIASVAGYSGVMVIAVRQIRRRMGLSAATLLVPRRDDVRSIVPAVRAVVGARRKLREVQG